MITVFRVLRPDEEPEKGLVAKDINAECLLSYFLHFGSKKNVKTQFIATTLSIETAYAWATKESKRNPLRIAMIQFDPDKYQWYDVSTKAKAYASMSKYPGETMKYKQGYYDICAKLASGSKEVDILRCINSADVTLLNINDVRYYINDPFAKGRYGTFEKFYKAECQ